MPRALMLQGTGSSVGKSVLVAGLCRALPAARAPGAAVQAAEHVQQRRRHGRGRRDRPGAGAAGARGRRGAQRAHEPGAAEAAERDRRAGRGAGPGVRHRPGARVPGDEARAAAARARQLRAPAARRPTSCWWRAPAARRRSTCAPATSPTWASPARPDAPVVVVGDIDRGGVIASLVGTHAVLDPADAALVRGFIVNRMRGDPSLFADGMRAIADRTGWAALGLVPFLPDAAPPAGRGRGRPARSHARPRRRACGSPCRCCRGSPISTISTRCAPSRVDLVCSAPGTPLPADCDLVILPGSKATIADLAALRAEGWDIDIARPCPARRPGAGPVRRLPDAGPQRRRPGGHRGPAGRVAGLGLLDVDTVLTGDKRLRRGRRARSPTAAPFRGYEMHMGRTTGPDARAPLLRSPTGGPTARVSPDGPRRGHLRARPVRRRRGSARPGCARSAPRRPALATRRRSRRRSTGSPRTSKRTWTSTGCSASRDERPAPGHRRDLQRAGDADRAPARAACRPASPRPARRPSRHPRPRRRHRRAARPAAGRARPPSPPPASRHSASGAGPRRATPRAAPAAAAPPGSSAAASTSHSAARREAGRLTRSSSRAAAQPNAACRARPVADHAVGGVDRLVGRMPGRPATQPQNGRRHHAVGEVLGQALDRGPHHARLVERFAGRGRRLRHRRRARRRARPAPARRRPRATWRVQAALGRARRWPGARGRRSRDRRRQQAVQRRMQERRRAGGEQSSDRPPRRRPHAPWHGRVAGPVQPRSSQAISAPIQTTGWRMARNSRRG